MSLSTRKRGSDRNVLQSCRKYVVAAALGGVICLLSPVAGNAQNTSMGEKFAELDAQVTRQTTQFVDAYAITQRNAAGDLETELYTADGAKLAGLTVSVADRVMQLSDALGAKNAAPFDLLVEEPATDWANAQLYQLWRDLEAEKASSKLAGSPAGEPSWEWRENYLRLAVSKEGGSIAAKQESDRVEDRIVGVMTRFGDVEAVSIRERNTEPILSKSGEAVPAPTFSTRLVDQRTGRPLGRANWTESTKTFAWNLPGLTSGFVNEERMEQSFPFQPNQAWSNIQVFGFWQMHLALAVSSSDPFAKNEPGCDGLHWLDNTVFRPCCDRHDLCFEKYGCSARSWFIFGSSWRCIRCNLSVVFCFLTGGGGGGGGGGGNCGVGAEPGGIDYQCP